MSKPALLLIFLFAWCFRGQAQPCTLPVDFFPEDSIMVCTGSSYNLSAPVIPGATYTWSNGETAASFNLNASGRHWVDISDGTCTVTDTVTVLLNSFLLSPVIGDAKLCRGQPHGPLPVWGNDLRWYTGPAGGTANPGQPTISVADTGRTVYWFSQTTLGCESPRVPMNVRIIDKPAFELGDAFIIPCGASGITIQVVDDHESDYLWNTGSRQISIVAPERGTYSLYAENMCGTHSDTTVAVACEDRCVQFPTAFSPNGDGVNDRYRAASFCPVPKFEMIIYNRNGEIVFKTTDPSAGWDGFYQGKAQPAGVYIVKSAFYDFILKNDFTHKGTFVLVR